MAAAEDEGGGGTVQASPLRRRPQAAQQAAAAATAATTAAATAPQPQAQPQQQDPPLLGRPMLLLFLLWAVLLYVRDMAGSNQRDAAPAAMGGAPAALSPVAIKPEHASVSGVVDGGVKPSLGLDPLGSSAAGSGGGVKHVLVQYCTS